jgi:hypothetical protein
MKGRLSALGAGLLIASSLVPVMILGPSPVLATAAVVDQHSESIPWEWSLNGDYAQTFTVGKSGSLSAVAIWLFTGINKHVAVQIAIHPLNASGFPNGFPVSTGTASVGDNDDFMEFSMSPANLTAGQHLAIVLHVLGSATNDCAVRGSDSDPYPGGRAEEYRNGAWQGFQLNSITDFAFRTYMVLPSKTLIVVPLPVHIATPSPGSQPTAAPNPTSAPAATATPAPAATPTSAPTAAPVASGSPSETPPIVVAIASATAAAGSPVAAASGPSGSPAAMSDVFNEDGSPGAHGADGVSLPLILAAIAVLAVVLAGLVLLFLRRRRREAEATET